MSRRNVVVEGQARSFVVVVPGGYDAAVAWPVVFAWHGLGGSGAQARARFGMEGAAGGGAIFVYPDGLPMGGVIPGTGWDLGADGRDVRFFDAMLAELSATLCLDLGRVFSTGHSFGGYITNTLGCTRGGVLRAIALVAGGTGPAAACGNKPLAAWLAHAMNDNVVAFAEGEKAHARWKLAAGCADTTRPTDPAPCVAHDGCGAATPVHWCVHQQAHAWPAFAGAAIWRFFASLK